jgi:hypothetical protein
MTISQILACVVIAVEVIPFDWIVRGLAKKKLETTSPAEAFAMGIRDGKKMLKYDGYILFISALTYFIVSVDNQWTWTASLVCFGVSKITFHRHPTLTTVVKVLGTALFVVLLYLHNW